MKRTAKALVIGAGCVALLGTLLIVGRRIVIGRSAANPVPRNTAEWRAHHQQIADRLQPGRTRVLWIGDSIVQRFEGPGQPVWDHYYAPRDAVNMGISGDRTEHVLWRLDNCRLESLSPTLAIVMIGQNNAPYCTAPQIAAGVSAIVSSLRQKLPATKILLLGIFFRGQKPNPEQTKLAQTNDLLAHLADGQHIFFLNINPIFLNPDGTIRPDLMPDFEHPNEAGCRAWAQAIEPQVAQLLAEPPLPP